MVDSSFSCDHRKISVYGKQKTSLSARKLAAKLWESEGCMNAFHSINGTNEESYGMTVASAKSGCDASKSLTASSNCDHVMKHHSVTRLFGKHKGKSADWRNKSEAAQLDMDSLNNIPIMSTDLQTVTNQIMHLESQYRLSKTIIASLHADLRSTRAQVYGLRIQQSAYKEDVIRLNQMLSHESIICRIKENMKTIPAIKALKEELEKERKFKSNLQWQYKKLYSELNVSKESLAKAMKELEKEQKAREMFEILLSKLARKKGEDKSQLQELKLQSMKAREEVEEERKMLQVAETLREGRVQMKLDEARQELQKQNTIFDNLQDKMGALSRSAGNEKKCSINVIPFKSGDMFPSFLDRENIDILHMDGEKAEVDESNMFLDDAIHWIELNNLSLNETKANGKWVHCLDTCKVECPKEPDNAVTQETGQHILHLDGIVGNKRWTS